MDETTIEQGEHDDLVDDAAAGDVDPRDVARAQVRELRERWEEEVTDRLHAERMQRAYDGRWSDDIPAMPGEDSAHQAAKRVVALGLVRYLVETASGLYDLEPTRVLRSETPEDRAWAERALWGFGSGLSAGMDRLDAMTRLGGTALLWLRYKASLRDPADLRAVLTGIGADLHPTAARLTEDVPLVPLEEGAQAGPAPVDGVEGIVIPRQRFVILPNEIDPRHVEAVAIQMGSRKAATTTTTSTTTTVSEPGREVVHLYMDRRYIALLHDWRPVPFDRETGESLIEHGFGDLPVICARQTDGDLEHYGEPWGGRDLWQTLLHLGRLLTEYGWTAVLQRGQPWTTAGRDARLALAPDTCIKLDDPQGKFGIASNNANLSGIRESIMTIVQLLARTLSIPSRALAVETSSMSGIAIAMDREVLADERRKRQRVARGWEVAAHELASLLYSRATGQAPRPGLESIEYRALPIVRTFSEDLQRIELERSEGLLSDLDMLRDLRPDLTDDERLERIARAQADRAARAPATSPPAPPSPDTEEAEQDDDSTDDATQAVQHT